MLVSDFSLGHDSRIADIRIANHGFFAFHEFPCPCCQTNRAMLDMNTMVFMPCNECKNNGWKTTRRLPLVEKIKAFLKL